MSAEIVSQSGSFSEELNERATRCTRVMEEILQQTYGNTPVELRKHLLDQSVNEPANVTVRDAALAGLPQTLPRAAA
jgi:pyruvate/oxaloacetate carboxyltransferase